ncbi:MAG: hypothetical protein NTW38_08095 [Candidatus Aminicenantes bacterium]|nr:hypothetical protein [Candidatus Aminicenantes bacterium]
MIRIHPSSIVRILETTALILLIATFEEILEMTGAILFIRGLLFYIAENDPQVLFHVKGRRGKGAPGVD